jgi:LGFP repeat
MTPLELTTAAANVAIELTATASAIDIKYAQLIKANPWIGAPRTAEQSCPDGVGRFRHYQGASIYWSPTTGAQLIYGLIRDKWAALGWERSPLGYPTTDELNAGSGKGRFNNFQNGTIIWKYEAKAAFAVYGRIYAKWGTTKWDTGFLGFPVTDELGTPDQVGRFNHFEGGSIYWTPNTDAKLIYGQIRNAWAAQGWETGRLGYPTTDELATPGTQGGRHNEFQGGTIFWTPQNGPRIVYKQVPIELWFSGFKCLDESNELSSKDEPYMFLGVSTSGSPQTPYETGVISVDAGDVIHRSVKLYAGNAQDVILAAVIRENDEGDPHAFAGPFKSILNLGNAALGSQTGGVTVPAEVVNLLANKLSELVGAGDDTVGMRSELLTQSYLLNMAAKGEGGQPVADFTWDIGKGSEGIYRLYFFVRRV